MISALPLEPYPRQPSAEEAAEELSKQIYQDEKPSLMERMADWFQEAIQRVLEGARGASPGGNLGVLIFALLIVAVAALLIWRFGVPGRTAKVRRTTDPVTPTRSATEHESRADAFAAEGKWAEAVRERLRGVVAGLVARDLVDNRPGRTAHEVAAEAGQVLPTVAADLVTAAELFAEIWYGERTATAEHDERMRTIAARVAAAQPSDEALVGADSWVAPGTPNGVRS
ncbi:DUF4129 domain-containing protein [Cryptosporangium aurantiacum]|uniref:Protein-glutamine gamma-glutamyltransferase-like C-terminal domain-containing protein n=1 Tax=Cryptosporangium aurantiacum TaxID=134849 RepID=A0A1M7RNE2_9ACTN|nr:DUF4129 domain-containing protein [Cryptosporangium aurantiacum]SHN47823.1 protein of unknown function [Cryptosporangium aurantiacum]